MSWSIVTGGPREIVLARVKETEIPTVFKEFLMETVQDALGDSISIDAREQVQKSSSQLTISIRSNSLAGKRGDEQDG